MNLFFRLLHVVGEEMRNVNGRKVESEKSVAGDFKHRF